jgi:hypothetical protein
VSGKKTCSKLVHWVPNSLIGGRNAVSEEPLEIQDEEDAESAGDLDGTDEPSGEAETADVEGEEAEVEAHGSWGGIG